MVLTETTKQGLDSFRPWLESELLRKQNRIGLTGLTGSSRSYFVSRWKETEESPILVIVPDLERAEAFCEDLRFFQKSGENSVFLLPPWETLPYDEIPPHPEIVRERVKCLFSITKKPAVVVSSVQALMQKVLPPSDLKNGTLVLSVGDEIDREGLIDFLAGGGYTQAKVVEERGDFSLRGAIIDIYTPFYEEPLRLEFYGDRLDSIRRFETETQRSLPESLMESAILLPARDHSQESLVSLFDYLSKDAILFIESWSEAEKEAMALTRLVQDHYQKALAKKGEVPPPDSMYLDDDEIRQRLDGFRLVYLEEGPVAPSECHSLFPFGMESNDDIRREMMTNVPSEAEHSPASPFSILRKKVRSWEEKGMRTFIVSHNPGQSERLRDLLSHYELEARRESERRFQEVLHEETKDLLLLVGTLSSGFRNPHEGWILLTEEEIFGERRRLRERKRRGSPFLSSLKELKEDDFVVHIDYGIGIYRGLKHLNIWGVSNDFLLLEYLEGDRVYVPVDRLNLVQRYNGGDGKPPRLDRLGSTVWQRTKKRVKAAVAEMAKDLLDLYAARQAFQGLNFPPLDPFYREFEATFEYEETPDQARAIQEVMRDMGNPKVMDRLICGDVGYGKTEVAIRAAYRAVMNGKQVAVLVPTTVLAQQHHQTFCERFKTYPVMIEVLSRFKTPREQKAIIQRLKEGKVDIVIGTHRLLQKDVVFRDLGFVVIDEEHRFGVTHKEKLKQLRKLVDVITLTATPIPRTLQMALTGIRDLSLIQTAPENRLSVRTFVVRYDDEVIREAILREFQRGGQVFFVHNRVHNIHAVANHLKRLVPEAALGVAHGQMKEKELEKMMLRFVRREYNLLVCTSIIESGLDIPAANTILINHAERFGLADLYQLRGRVGRGSHQAYAYLLVPSDLALSEDAMKRLRAIQELSDLGSGFKLALHDLEIRGAGNLLGSSQSGHVLAVGFEYYTQMLEKAILELKGETVEEEITPEIHFRLPAFIPEDYVEQPSERLSLYRRLSFCRSEEEVERIREELTDRFGTIPEEASHLLEVIKVKVVLTKLAVRKLEESADQLVITFDESTKVSPKRILELVHRGKGRYRLTPDSKLIVEGWAEMRTSPFESAKKLLQALA